MKGPDFQTTGGVAAVAIEVPKRGPTLVRAGATERWERIGQAEALDAHEASIPQRTLEILARSFFKEASSYGFDLPDYLRFVNVLLEAAMQQTGETEAPRQTVPAWHEGPRTNLPLCGEKVRVRALDRPRDEALLHKWFADPMGRHFLLSRATARALDVEELIRSPHNVLGVITVPDGAPVGLVAFLDHDPQQHKAELRKLIGEAAMRGRGLAKQATRLWIQHGARSLGIRKLVVNTLDTHLRNIRLNEELGFKVEGVLRNEVCFDGSYHDVLRMGLCIQEKA